MKYNKIKNKAQATHGLRICRNGEPIVFFTILLLLFNCCYYNYSNYNNYPNYSKDNHRSTRKIGDNLYKETYTTYKGNATTTDSYTVYLTDSLTFRVYIGTVLDEGTEFIGTIQIDDDNVFVYKTEEKFDADFVNSKGAIRNRDTLEKKTYNIPALKKEGKFE